MKIIYLYNQLGAGPLMISSLLVSNIKPNEPFFIIVNERLKNEGRASHIRVFRTYDNLILRLAVRFFIELFYIPHIAIKHKSKELLAFGNFNMIPFPLTKRILIHHPYLVDDSALKKLPLFPRTIEMLKRGYFKAQTYIFRHNQYVAQTQDFKRQLELKYNINNVLLIPNPVTDKISFPVSSEFEKILTSRLNRFDELNLLYVSRYYPHKNHLFLIELAKQIEKLDLNIKIKITVDTNALPQKIMTEIIRSDILINIGEVEQKDLANEYLHSHICIFPSLTETFGNGLIEAAKFGLPTLAFDLPYVKDVLEHNVKSIQSVDSCIESLKFYARNPMIYQKESIDIYEYSSKFINVSTWKNLLLNK
ncbi:glycosyltransferase family 4 protein [Pseudoalteromonas atlantica]|uniref:glycosyltransferase family 4 protein n=1 Tax=Pseudoalteromonas atlantica TaxID=288 RepID=UPI00373622D7